MTHELEIRRVPPGMSGHPEGTPLGAPQPARRKVKRTDYTRKPKTWSPARRAKFMATMKKRAKKGGAARATTGAATKRAVSAVPAASDAMTAAPPIHPPHSLVPAEDRRTRLQDAIEEIRKERDSLTVILEHLERLIA